MLQGVLHLGNALQAKQRTRLNKDVTASQQDPAGLTGWHSEFADQIEGWFKETATWDAGAELPQDASLPGV